MQILLLSTGIVSPAALAPAGGGAALAGKRQVHGSSAGNVNKRRDPDDHLQSGRARPMQFCRDPEVSR